MNLFLASGQCLQTIEQNILHSSDVLQIQCVYISDEIRIKDVLIRAKKAEITLIFRFDCIVNIMRFDKNSPCGRILPVR